MPTSLETIGIFEGQYIIDRYRTFLAKSDMISINFDKLKNLNWAKLIIYTKTPLISVQNSFLIEKTLQITPFVLHNT